MRPTLILALFTIPFMLFLLVLIRPDPHSYNENAVKTYCAPVETQHYPYGITGESLQLCGGKIRSGDHLSGLFYALGISQARITAAVNRAKGVFDVRKLVAGNPYSIIEECDSVRYFIFEKDRVNYVVFDFGDSVSVYNGAKPIETRIKSAAGFIHSSLYETLEANNLPLQLAGELSSIYAWTIDFYRLQAGDGFKVIYEEKFVDGQSIGVGKVYASQFSHFGRDFFAVEFRQDNNGEFFDEEGNSLRKAFLKAPLKFSRITSGYTHRRFHPIYKRYTSHLGIDYAAPHGTPIMAVGDGVVIEARYKGGNGNYVKIRHNGTYSTQYLHMSRFAKGLRPGTPVKQSDVIGYVGSTGLSTGPHVCFRFWKNGRQVNPFREEIPPSEPIRPENRQAYMNVAREWLCRLKEIPTAQEAESGTVAFQ